MQYPIVKSIINNTFLPNYYTIRDYFEENKLGYNNEYKIDGGFTIHFSGSDIKELFKKNLNIQPKNWYYRDHSVKYTLNSLGYRDKEFDEIDWKESIVMFGCSFIFGTGVTDEHTIPYFLEKLSGRPVVNLGMASSSIQTALHNSIILRDSKYPIPKAIIYLWTSFERFNIYANNSTNCIGYWNADKVNQKFSNPKNLVPFNLMNIKMIRNLWKNNTAYYEYALNQNNSLIDKLDNTVKCNTTPAMTKPNTNARDLGHFGSKTNLIIAENMYEKMKNEGVI